MENIAIYSAQGFLSAPVIDTSLSLEIVMSGADKQTAENIKQKLVGVYGAETELALDGKAVALGSVTADKLAKSSKISIAAVADFSKARYNVSDAMRITKMLTHPENGCPWDRAQTHESIRINLIEEAYEAVDAIDKHDVANMREEFGDVLLQSLLQSDIARRSGEFDFNDVCDELCKKLISRHTWIFSGDEADNADDALVLWDKAKATEKKYESVKDQLERLPEEFPSLLRCQKAYKKIKKSGAAVDPKGELDAALAAGDHAAVIAACCELLAEEGKDAEVELNKLIKAKIESL